MIVSEEARQFIRSQLPPSKGILAELEQYAHDHYVPIARPEAAAFLRTICALKQPDNILEAGTAIGYSALVMAPYVSKGGRIDTVELDEETAEIAKKNIAAAGFSDQIHVIVADAAEVFACLERQYDLIFLDAAKGQYKAMLPDAKRLLKPGGILLSDNILFDGRVSEEGHVPHKHRTIVVNLREYLKDLIEDPELETSLLSVGDGMAFSVKKWKEEQI